MAFGGSYFGGLDVYALTRLRPHNSESTSVNFSKMYDSCKFNPAKVLAYSVYGKCVCLEGGRGKGCLLEWRGVREGRGMREGEG